MAMLRAHRERGSVQFHFRFSFSFGASRSTCVHDLHSRPAFTTCIHGGSAASAPRSRHRSAAAALAPAEIQSESSRRAAPGAQPRPDPPDRSAEAARASGDPCRAPMGRALRHPQTLLRRPCVLRQPHGPKSPAHPAYLRPTTRPRRRPHPHPHRLPGPVRFRVPRYRRLRPSLTSPGPRQPAHEAAGQVQHRIHYRREQMYRTCFFPVPACCPVSQSAASPVGRSGWPDRLGSPPVSPGHVPRGPMHRVCVRRHAPVLSPAW